MKKKGTRCAVLDFERNLQFWSLNTYIWFERASNLWFWEWFLKKFETSNFVDFPKHLELGLV
jgi:hypothetical protein